MDAIGKPMVVKEVLQRECPRDGAVVRVEGSGICRSDWHLWTGDWTWIGFYQKLPAILGHEFAGVVEEVGPEVKNLKRGERVVVPFCQGCGACEDCRTGHSNLCFGTSRVRKKDNQRARQTGMPTAVLENRTGKFVKPDLSSGTSALASIKLPPDLRAFAPSA